MKQFFFIIIIVFIAACKSNFKTKKETNHYKLIIEKGDIIDLNKIFNNEVIDEKFDFYFSDKLFHDIYVYDFKNKTIYLEPINKHMPSLGYRDMRESKYSIDVDTIGLGKLRIKIDNVINPENNIISMNRLINPPVILIAEKTRKR
ncbi:MAG: hypothetical protein CMP76_17430 [Flavobacterium sp.]|uniref:hypothetical protein n=1 Tax=Flavobacterium sp. TaxID=239 RepID=UPI000C68A83E|nr:hypothetical protein [Flavobacterium sp.]MBF05062.1 hypothetical protein [Flavobacterium sp.]|tara:strand:+ start:1053 stop:1490 length:438 start_codon:yes stop_codon:yes gene_type:complete